MLVTGERYSTRNSGVLQIVLDKGHNKVSVLFPSTGYVKHNVTRQAIQKGKVKDPFYPSVYGKGYVGEGKYSQTYNRNLYGVWKNMLGRCYSPKQQERQPTYRGCTVCAAWLNLQTFGKWYEANFEEGLCLDKDILSGEFKQYSPSTCQFVTYATNTQEAHAKIYQFVSPQGVQTEIYNLSKFCRENDLTQANMAKVSTGERQRHKGWCLPKMPTG